jgi:hypothetical protein
MLPPPARLQFLDSHIISISLPFSNLLSETLPPLSWLLIDSNLHSLKEGRKLSGFPLAAKKSFILLLLTSYVLLTKFLKKYTTIATFKKVNLNRKV